MKINWNFLGGGGGCKTKNLPWREYGHFLEQLHIKVRKKLAEFLKFSSCVLKKLQKKYGLLSLLNFILYLLPNSAGTFCVRAKALSNNFSTELTWTQQNSRDSAPLNLNTIIIKSKYGDPDLDGLQLKSNV